MMTPNSNVRVSILERLVPSLAFALVAISGAVGSAMLLKLLSALRRAESAGYAALFGGLTEVEFAVAVLLVFAAVLGALGMLVSIIRLFTTNTKSSPPGLLFLVTGLVSLVPPFALHWVMHAMKEVVRTPSGGGIATIASTITTVTWFAIVSACVIALVLVAFTFIPFSSRPGRKALPLVSLVLVEILIAGLAGIYFWEASRSMTYRDQGFVSNTETVRPSSTNTNSFESGLNTIANEAAPDDTTSNPRGKTISGGILNDKAITLPKPAYPPAARAANATGNVLVQVLVDEEGGVVSANAVSGNPLLRSAAVQAARAARFAPTKIAGQPVKVSGVLTFNFSDQ